MVASEAKPVNTTPSSIGPSAGRAYAKSRRNTIASTPLRENVGQIPVARHATGRHRFNQKQGGDCAEVQVATLSREELQQRVQRLRWWHIIDLGRGVIDRKSTRLN